MTFEEIEKRIKNDSEWGVYDIEPSLLNGATRISNGIRLALNEGGEPIKTSPFTPATIDLSEFIKNEPLYNELKECASRFIGGDFGTFYEYGDPVIEGREYGEYKTGFGVIQIHREGDVVVVYLPFER